MVVQDMLDYLRDVVDRQGGTGGGGGDLPAGGTSGQALIKESSTDGDAGWHDLPPGVTYTHNQSAIASVWTIAHGLNTFPSVTVVDTGGNEIIPDVSFVSSNQINLVFSAPTSGKAYLN
jgi:hypothetical protein